MAASLVSWVWAQKLTPTQRLVLLALNERVAWHDFRGRWECVPSYSGIATMTGYSRGTVVREIAKLVALGILTIEPRFDGLGRQRHNYFVVNAGYKL
ncbi:hypothetical protein DRQ53_08025 [bacterium]|nr:MAG: hypothetical protein DRQ53_08025 [bacterium]